MEWNSCIYIIAGTGDDHGGNMQLNIAPTAAALTNHEFPHIWIPTSADIPWGGNFGGIAADAGEVLDNSTWVFACRLGFRADYNGTTGGGEWEGKAFIGWADTGDTSIMTHDTGVITIASDGPLVGFHIPEDGSIDGISHRTAATAMAEGTNFTELVAATGVDNTVLNGCVAAYETVWYDLALRMDITDMSLDAGNGTTTFYYRRVLPQSPLPAWTVHTTQLDNQTPNSATTMVPTIEVLTSSTADEDVALLIDWWAMGRSRVNRNAGV
jgi:hypothetical protein